MPSHRLAVIPATFAQFDIVGELGESDFVKHVGLVVEDGSYMPHRVPACHMAPPMENWQPINAGVQGTAELTDDERRKIKVFVERHEQEHASPRALTGNALRLALPSIYCIYPHVKPYPEKDGRYVRMRFSCAGFAIEAYRFARITLLDESRLPDVDLNQVKMHYPKVAFLLDQSKFRISMGLEHGDAWPVVFCGYLLHSLKRTRDEIKDYPYQPNESDAWYT